MKLLSYRSVLLLCHGKKKIIYMISVMLSHKSIIINLFIINTNNTKIFESFHIRLLVMNSFKHVHTNSTWTNEVKLRKMLEDQHSAGSA